MKTKKIQYLILVLLVATVCLVSGCAREDAQQEATAAEQTQPVESAEAEETTQPTETLEMENHVADVSVETPWLTMTIPGEFAANIKHAEVTEENITMELFFMVTEEMEIEIFRVYFGDVKTGSYLGSLYENGEKIPVTLSISNYSEEMFPDEETRALYYELMDGMNEILGGIYSDSRFSSEENLVVEREEKELSYWEFSLPAGMDVEEKHEDGAYQADFYGTVDGNRFLLYSVALGESPLKTVMGTYSVDGNSMVVSLESYDLPDVTGWTYDAEMELYQMIDSINDVIQVITSSEGFAAEIPEA